MTHKLIPRQNSQNKTGNQLVLDCLLFFLCLCVSFLLISQGLREDGLFCTCQFEELSVLQRKAPTALKAKGIQ